MADHSQHFYPHYGHHRLNYQYPIEQFAAFEQLPTKKRFYTIVKAVVILSGLGSMVLGVQELKKALQHNDHKRLPRAATLIGGGLALALIWFSIWQLVTVPAAPHFKKLSTYTQANSSAGYQLELPVEFKQQTLAGVDDVQALGYGKSKDTRLAFGRISTTAVGTSPATRERALSGLKDSQSGLFQAFTQAVQTGADYNKLTIESFKDFTAANGKPMLIGSVHFVMNNGQEMDGQMLIGFGESSQYTLLLAADNDTWAANDSIWQAVLKSFTITR